MSAQPPLDTEQLIQRVRRDLLDSWDEEIEMDVEDRVTPPRGRLHAREGDHARAKPHPRVEVVGRAGGRQEARAPQLHRSPAQAVSVRGSSEVERGAAQARASRTLFAPGRAARDAGARDLLGVPGGGLRVMTRKPPPGTTQFTTQLVRVRTTRRFCARPSTVVLSATGSASPWPSTASCVTLMPREDR